jgi:hypothetical protein
MPFRWKLRRLDKLPVPPPADDSPLTRGSLYHLKIEEYIRSGTEPLPDIKNPLAKEVIELCREKFLAGVGEPEKPTYLDTNWLPTQKNADDHWLTAITDFEYIEDNILYIIDWKTGKPRNKRKSLMPCRPSSMLSSAWPQTPRSPLWRPGLSTWTPSRTPSRNSLPAPEQSRSESPGITKPSNSPMPLNSQPNP